MKIIQVVPTVEEKAAGPSYSVPGMCRGLAAVGEDVELHSYGYNTTPGCSYRQCIYAQNRFLNIRRLAFSSEMRRGLRLACKGADVVHTNCVWMMPSLYAIWGAANAGCKAVLSPRGGLAAWTLKRNRLIKRAFERVWLEQALSRVSMFHATSQKEYEEIRAKGLRQPVAIIPIGMDIPQVQKVSSERRKIVFFGRLHSVKKVDDLLLAWERVATRMPDWDVEIAGPDYGSEGELRQLVAAHDIPRVKFVGTITGQAKYDFLASADLYVLPSLTENFGITIAEALACGTPVVVSQGTPWRDVVRHKCGWWIPNGDLPLSEALLAASQMSKDDLRQMGERGRQWMEDDFSWKAIGRQLKGAYEWLLQKSDRPECVIVD